MALKEQLGKASCCVCDFSTKRIMMLEFSRYLENYLWPHFTEKEVDLIRGQVQELVALPIWVNLLPGRREDLFKKNPKYRKFYNVMLKKDAKLPEKAREQTQFQRQFLSNLFATYLEVLHSIPEKGKFPLTKAHYCERFLELMIDIEAQLLTRRCVNELMDAKHIVVHSKLSTLRGRPEGKLFTQLLEMLEMYAQFEIDEKTGEALTVWKNERKRSQLEMINEMPLYPTEKIIWDENIVPSEYFSGEGCLALPKLNLQCLTLHDYLLRNFNLFRLESTYEIRQDIEDALTHMKPWKAEDGHCMFGGWARMAQPIVSFNVVEVPIGYRYKYNEDFVSQVGLVYVRGCEIEGMLDEQGKVIEEGPDPKPDLRGDNRTYRVWLDPNQYQLDMMRTVQGGEDVYETFNVILRRKPKENNFKAVLETIRDLMNTNCVVPGWLHDLILGYGTPDSAHYSKMQNKMMTLDWNDTFLDLDHLKASLPKVGEFKVVGQHEAKPPFRYWNTIPFTPAQIEAIRAGMQRALNQLFEKIIALDIDERHLLRLGHGEEALETEKDFSRAAWGCLVDMSYTCETAGYFYMYQVSQLTHFAGAGQMGEFQSKIKSYRDKEGGVKQIKQLFPFTKFFDNAPQPLFHGESFEKDMDIAEGCFRHIRKIFTQLEEFRAFELLRSGADRANYLLIKEAKIIAMTCTHAALKRRDLVNVGFQFDNILMEEAAQILEIETFIPLLLQNPEDGNNRLKRWIMIGDHHQLPPVIKNMAFQKFSNMEQSLFTRFVRLGVPTVDLDAQGRARASIASLYNWRYKRLGSLPHVITQPQYRLANAGFMFDFQLINVSDFNGVGESEPNPYFYQNLGEAEYVVALFMYMRLIGYPAEKISILTTYNGQKHLIRDVIAQRCANNPFIGKPHKVTTVDRYQGQQNDYIILSLVRTRTVGHLRDVRRLVVAMSRARLGLYIFARVSLFSNCFELTPAFNRLTARPTKLHLVPSETFPSQRKVQEPPQEPPMMIEDMPQMAQFVYDFYNARIDQLMRMRGFNQKTLLRQPPKQRARKDDS
nr:hypothetical protein BaRGS_013372 [Batillaria attramentaria]